MIRIYSQTSTGIQRTTDIKTVGDDFEHVFWLDLLNATPDEIRSVEKLMELAMPTHDEMREIEATSRLYREDGASFMTTTILSRVDTETPVLSEITFILADKRIITIRHSDSYSFRLFSHQLLRKNTINRDMVFIGLLESIVDRQADILERFNTELDKVSKTIFAKKEGVDDNKNEKGTKTLRLVLLELGRIGDLVSRQRDCFVNILRLLTYASNEGAQDTPETTLYTRLRPLHRDVTSLSEYASFLANNVNFMLDAVLGFINIEQNEIIKIFSVAAVIFMPPTLIASIYGMNFKEMPELDMKYGYYITLFVMVVSVVALLIYFKRRKLL